MARRCTVRDVAARTGVSWHAAVITLTAALLPGTAVAQVFESVGTRALGMAGAFVGVADDATAVYWNPAGLATGGLFSLIVDGQTADTRVDPSRSDTPGTVASGWFAGMTTNAAGLSYYRLRANQLDRPSSPGAVPGDARQDPGDEATLRSLITHNVALTTVSMVAPGLSVGTTLRYVYGAAGVTGAAPGVSTDDLLLQADGLDRQTKHKYDIDVGMMIGSPTFRVGFVARNLRQPSFSVPDGGSVRLNRHVRSGVAMRLPTGSLLALDVDLTRTHTVAGDRRALAVGGEHWFGEWFAVRGGARVNLAQHERQMAGAFGLSIALAAGLFLDAQVTRGRESTERGWSLSGRIGL